MYLDVATSDQQVMYKQCSTEEQKSWLGPGVTDGQEILVVVVEGDETVNGAIVANGQEALVRAIVLAEGDET